MPTQSGDDSSGGTKPLTPDTTQASLANAAAVEQARLTVRTFGPLSEVPIGTGPLKFKGAVGVVWSTTEQRSEVTITGLEIAGSVQGDIAIRKAAGWDVLPAGTSGKVLTTKGTGADPAWESAREAAGMMKLWPKLSGVSPVVPPAGYLLCNGAAVSRSTYADLFAVIGESYGPGDGSTTFNVPSLADHTL